MPAKFIFSKNIRRVDAHGNLITITGTCCNGVLRLTGQINASTVREETVWGCYTQERADQQADQMALLIERSTQPPVRDVAA